MGQQPIRLCPMGMDLIVKQSIGVVLYLFQTCFFIHYFILQLLLFQALGALFNLFIYCLLGKSQTLFGKLQAFSFIYMLQQTDCSFKQLLYQSPGNKIMSLDQPKLGVCKVDLSSFYPSASLKAIVTSHHSKHQLHKLVTMVNLHVPLSTARSYRAK